LITKLTLSDSSLESGDHQIFPSSISDSNSLALHADHAVEVVIGGGDGVGVVHEDGVCGTGCSQLHMLHHGRDYQVCIHKNPSNKVLATTSATTMGHNISGLVGMGMGQQHRRSAIKIKQPTAKKAAWNGTAWASYLLPPVFLSFSSLMARTC
jgi:hypothetical protein